MSTAIVFDLVLKRAVQAASVVPVALPNVAQGDIVPLALYFQTRDAAGDLVYQDNAGATVKAAIVVPASKPTGGTFTLTCDGDTTTALAYNATAATVQAALEALAAIGAGNVAVTGPAGGPWKAVFQDDLANTDVPLITGDGRLLTPQAQALTAVAVAGGGGNDEIQVIRLARAPLALCVGTEIGDANHGWDVILDMDTLGIAELVEGKTGSRATLEVELTRPDGSRETFQESILVINDGIEQGGATPLSLEDALTESTADARYVRKAGSVMTGDLEFNTAVIGVILKSPAGTRARLTLNDDMTIQVTPL